MTEVTYDIDQIDLPELERRYDLAVQALGELYHRRPDLGAWQREVSAATAAVMEAALALSAGEAVKLSAEAELDALYPPERTGSREPATPAVAGSPDSMKALQA